MDEKLMVKCKTCGLEFAAEAQLDPESFEAVGMSNTSYECPRGHTATYDKEDHFFR